MTKPDWGDKNNIIMEHITTIDIKCGAYVTVCTVRLNHEMRTSFISNANIIGAGNPAYQRIKAYEQSVANDLVKIITAEKLLKISKTYPITAPEPFAY